MAKAASKMSKKSGSKKGAKKGSKKTFASYIKRVLKQATKGKLGMSSKTTAVVNSFVTDMFDRIATEAAALARANKKSTIGSREIQTAVRLTLPAELAKHSMAEAVKAVAKVSK